MIELCVTVKLMDFPQDFPISLAQSIMLSSNLEPRIEDACYINFEKLPRHCHNYNISFVALIHSKKARRLIH